MEVWQGVRKEATRDLGTRHRHTRRNGAKRDLGDDGGRLLGGGGGCHDALCPRGASGGAGHGCILLPQAPTHRSAEHRIRS
jgi:hypothetical protein